MFSRLTEELDSYLKMGIPGYDCIVYHDGKCVYRHFNGYSDIDQKIPLTGTERYNIYSCSKPITCTAALQLYEKGLFSLDDKLSDYMPEFETMYIKDENGVRKAKKHITIRNLFCMTAGFSYDINSPMLELGKRETNGKCQTREMMKYLAQEPLLFEPGERWEYSLCHDVLAALVETLSGMCFGEYVRKNIFDVLGMNHSTFLLEDAALDTITTQYCYHNETNKAEVCEKNIAYKLGSEYESGGAGCISTVEDYIKFLEAMRIGNVILKKETIDLMATNQLTENHFKTYWLKEEGYGYGLGVRCPLDDDVSDFGWDGAAGAYLMIDRKNKITVYYGQHVLNPPNADQRRVIAPMVREILA